MKKFLKSLTLIFVGFLVTVILSLIFTNSKNISCNKYDSIKDDIYGASFIQCNEDATRSIIGIPIVILDLNQNPNGPDIAVYPKYSTSIKLNTEEPEVLNISRKVYYPAGLIINTIIFSAVAFYLYKFISYENSRH